jgi:hypothetical protein
VDAPENKYQRRIRIFQVLLVVFFAVFMAYRLLLPWTPLWIDLLSIVAGSIFLVTVAKRSAPTSGGESKVKEGDAL